MATSNNAEFESMCYRFSFGTVIWFGRLWLFGLLLFSAVYIGVELFDFGNRFGSDGSTQLAPLLKGYLQALPPRVMKLMGLCFLSLAGVGLTLEKSAFAQFAAALICIAVHIVLLGALV